MSEFSDSYHLRSDSQQDGIDVLRTAGLRGYVFPAENGWVTVVAKGRSFKPNKRLIAAAPGVLLHYMNAPDTGWGFELYRDGQVLARYEAEWDNDVRAVLNEIDRGVLEQHLGDGIRGLDGEGYRGIFSPGFDDFIAVVTGNAEPFAERFATAAGLTNYSWTSYSYVNSDYDDEPELAARGVVCVD
jgi:hypothetical protein